MLCAKKGALHLVSNQQLLEAVVIIATLTIIST